jgi:hypothetical protein
MIVERMTANLVKVDGKYLLLRKAISSISIIDDAVYGDDKLLITLQELEASSQRIMLIFNDGDSND